MSRIIRRLLRSELLEFPLNIQIILFKDVGKIEVGIVVKHEYSSIRKQLVDEKILLTETEKNISGIGCLKKSKDDYAEIKRMYVRAEFRGKGLGKLILTKLIESAKDIGYNYIRLDSTKFMKEAHSIYNSVGFNEIEPYPESEIPDEFKSHWIFIQLKI